MGIPNRRGAVDPLEKPVETTMPRHELREVIGHLPMRPGNPPAKQALGDLDASLLAARTTCPKSRAHFANTRALRDRGSFACTASAGSPGGRGPPSSVPVAHVALLASNDANRSSVIRVMGMVRATTIPAS